MKSVSLYSVYGTAASHIVDVVVNHCTLAYYKVTTCNMHSVQQHYISYERAAICRKYLDCLSARDVRRNCYGGVEFKVCDSFLRPPRIDESSWSSLSEVKSGEERRGGRQGSLREDIGEVGGEIGGYECRLLGRDGWRGRICNEGMMSLMLALLCIQRTGEIKFLDVSNDRREARFQAALML